MSEYVWVALSHGEPIHIFKSEKAAVESGYQFITEVPRRYAVANIRHQLFLRSGGQCENCDANLTEKSGHMHERVWRGQGGDISLENSIFICFKCHGFAHRERAPQFTRRKQ